MARHHRQRRWRTPNETNAENNNQEGGAAPSWVADSDEISQPEPQTEISQPQPLCQPGLNSAAVSFVPRDGSHQEVPVLDQDAGPQAPKALALVGIASQPPFAYEGRVYYPNNSESQANGEQLGAQATHTKNTHRSTQSHPRGLGNGAERACILHVMNKWCHLCGETPQGSVSFADGVAANLINARSQAHAEAKDF